MKKRGLNHNGVLLDDKGKPLSKYARKRAEEKPVTVHLKSRRSGVDLRHVVINGQHLGNVSDE